MPGRMVVRLVSGSYAYGTDTDDSDCDYRMVFQLPNSEFLGLGTPNSTHTDPLDQVGHELAHYLRLLLKGNPNLVEMPFIRPEWWIESSDTWKAIVDVRERWITRAMASAYRGWIFGELAKIGKSPTMTPKRISHCVRLAYELRGALYDRIIQPHLTGWQQHKVMDFKEGRLDGATAILEVEAIMEEISDHTLQALPEPPTELAAAILEEARRKHGG